jgi:hypothetical protein
MHAAAPPCWPTFTSGPAPEGVLADISRWRYISHFNESSPGTSQAIKSLFGLQAPRQQASSSAASAARLAASQRVSHCGTHLQNAALAAASTLVSPSHNCLGADPMLCRRWQRLLIDDVSLAQLARPSTSQFEFA